LNGGRVALVTRHDVDLVGLHLTFEPHLGLALDQDVVGNPGRVSSATDIGVPAVWRIGSVV
jgi:hypothetical protein